MALPRINSVPKYEMTVPSSGQKVMFRPFLVKEEKVLMMAMERWFSLLIQTLFVGNLIHIILLMVVLVILH